MVKIIALDEFGVFESRSSGFRFVGGYTLNSSGYEEEKNRMATFLINFCNEFNYKYLRKYSDVKAYYPYSLHGGSKDSPFFRNQPEGNARRDKEKKVSVAYDAELRHLAWQFKNDLCEKAAKYIFDRKGIMYAYLDPFVDDENAER